MRKFNPYFGTIALVAAIVMFGCSSKQVLTQLDVVLSAVETAIPVIGSIANVNPTTQIVIVSYLHEVGKASSEAGAILASSESDAAKATDIVRAFSSAIAPLLPSGTPQVIVQVVQVISDAVAKFVANFNNASASERSKASTSHHLTFVGKDAKKLEAERSKASDVVRVLGLLRKR